MKTCVFSGLLAGWVLTTAVMAADAPVDLLHGRMEVLLKRLHDASKEDNYPVKDYLADLNAIGRDAAGDPELAKAVAAGKDDSAVDAMLKLAVRIQEPQEVERTMIIGECYGCPARYARMDRARAYRRAQAAGNPQPPGEMPQFIFPITFRNEADIFPAAAVVRSNQASMESCGMPQAMSLQDDQAQPAFLTAWEFWLMSPPSLERENMLPRIFEALGKIKDEHVLTLMLELFKTETDRAFAQSKPVVAADWIRSINLIPGPAALDALMQCNRIAIAGGFSDSGRTGVCREIARCLASYDASRDVMADPVMVKMLTESGSDIRKPEDIPPLNDAWKIYKPLIVARLRAERLKGKEEAKMPPEDKEVLKAAMVIMPKD